MTVAELQLLLSDLGKFLRPLRGREGCRRVGVHLRAACPVQGVQAQGVCGLLVQAEAYSRGALAPKAKGGGRGRKTPPPLRGRVAHPSLYQRATDPGTTVSKSRIPCGS